MSKIRADGGCWPKLTKEQIARLVSLRAEGIGLKELAIRFSVSRTTIQRLSRESRKT